ncbi:MAG: ThiF family adenylyltransferase [Phycisphaerales bacterium]|nr:ThiF family adenylyltransferase [Phycisphaerales bacterium]
MNASRYQRQVILPQVGEDGQSLLASARVLVAGCGALGCAVADLLARAGVGSLRLVDRDLVELSNLQRQVLYAEPDVGMAKADAAANRLASINSTIDIDAHVTDINPMTVGGLAEGCDVIVDGLDNFETRYLLNDVSVSMSVPYIYGGAVGTEGLSFPILPGENSACLRCVFPDPPPSGATATCDTAGVLGPIITMVAAHEALQVLKLLLKQDADLDHSLVSFDVWHNEIRRIAAPVKDSECVCCAHHQFEWLDGTRCGTTTTLCGRGAVQILPGSSDRVDLKDLSIRLEAHGEFSLHDGILRGQLHEERNGDGDLVELTVFEDLRAMVGRVDSTERAKAIYDRYVGS